MFLMRNFFLLTYLLSYFDCVPDRVEVPAKMQFEDTGTFFQVWSYK